MSGPSTYELYEAPLYHPEGVGQAPLPPPTAWGTQWYGCSQDCEGTADVIFCGYCQLGYQYTMLTTGHQGMHFPVALVPLFIDCISFHGLALAIGTYYVRSMFRSKYNINPSDDCTEFLIPICCPGCALCQQYRELVLRQQWPNGVCVGDSPPNISAMG